MHCLHHLELGVTVLALDHGGSLTSRRFVTEATERDDLTGQHVDPFWPANTWMEIEAVGRWQSS
jgi:hypothetical protein